MSTSTETLEQQELATAREQAARIIEFARKNEAFRQRAAQDPAGTLRAFGVAEHAISRFVGSEAEILPCTDTTCWSSGCPGTCYVTVYMPEPGMPGV